MRAYKFHGLSDHDLLRELATLVSRERSATAAVVACLAEVEERRLYLPAGYPSLHAYCVGELRLSEDSAYKRIRAARVAQAIPAVITSLSDGRLNLSGVVLLAPYLRPENAETLIEAAAGKRRSEIEELIARRFPSSEALPMLCAVPTSATGQLAPGPVIPRTAERKDHRAKLSGPAAGLATTAPIAPERFSLQVTIGASTHEKLVCLQELLSHRIPSGDLTEVLDYALNVALSHAQKAKFAATEKPRPQVLRSIRRRTIPAEVQRAVWKRDAGQCTFISDQGHRCGSRRFLEYDHVEPVARGGQATVEGIRLRCRAHNQYEAEQVFGRAFMEQKRHAARQVHHPRTVFGQDTRDLTEGLRNLGFGADEIRRAVSCHAPVSEASLEERMLAAIRFLRPKKRSPVT